MMLSVFIVLLPPLTVGLMYMANQVARGNAIGLTMLFSGARRFLTAVTSGERLTLLPSCWFWLI